MRMADPKQEKPHSSPTAAAPSESDEAIARAMGGVLSEEQQKLIEDLDREAGVRKPADPLLAKLLWWACIGVTLYHFITSFIGTPVILKHRSLHVAMMLALAFILYPFSRESSYKRVAWYDWILVLLSLAVPIYVWADYLGVVERAGMPDTMDVCVATLLVALVLEASRRVSGKNSSA